MSENRNIGDGGMHTHHSESSDKQSTRSHHGEHSHHRSHSHSTEHSHHSHHSHSSSHRSEHRHYSHRRSHSSSRSIKSKLKKVWSKIKRLFDTNDKKKKASRICSLAIVIVLLFAISVELIEDIHFNWLDKKMSETQTDDTSDVINVDLVNGEGVLVTSAVVNFMKVNLSYSTGINVNTFVMPGERIDEQKPVVMNLSTNNHGALYYKIELADNEKLENARVDYVHGSRGSYTLEHLYVNTEYHYRVTAYTAHGEFTERGSFRTADTPRFLTIDGARNVRDIGNWQTDSGKRIKQGLLIRGTELDAAERSDCHITDKGLFDLINVYGIKTDFDLRNYEWLLNRKPQIDENGEEIPLRMPMDALGSRVEHNYYSSPSYEGIFTAEGKTLVCAIFKDLANAENYPMYLHCTHGADRTGTICYLLEALLGVSPEDCLKDYALTSGVDVKDILLVTSGLKAYDYTGTMTLREQTELYLMDCGLNMYEIATIREIFLGE